MKLTEPFVTLDGVYQGPGEPDETAQRGSTGAVAGAVRRRETGGSSPSCSSAWTRCSSGRMTFDIWDAYWPPSTTAATRLPRDQRPAQIRALDHPQEPDLAEHPRPRRRRRCQPYGCTNADPSTRLRPHVRRPGRSTRRDIVRRAIDGEEGVAELAEPLPDELRGRAEARRDPRAGRARHQGAHRAPQGRPHQPRGAARGAPPARPVRGAVARADRPHDRALVGRPEHQGGAPR